MALAGAPHRARDQSITLRKILCEDEAQPRDYGARSLMLNIKSVGQKGRHRVSKPQDIKRVGTWNLDRFKVHGGH